MSFTSLTLRTTYAMVSCVCWWVLLAGNAFGDGVTVRELFVPESELPNLIDAVQQRVVLPRAEFEQLLRDTATKDTAPDAPPPVEAIVQASSYTITIAEERAVIDVAFTIECLGKTKTPVPVAVPIECAGVALLSALLEREDKVSEAVVAPLGFRDANTALLILTQPGTYTLTCRFTAPLTIDATQQRLAFTLPRGMKTACLLRVPGDVELAGGAAILSRSVTAGDAGSVTHFDLLLPPERATQLLLSLNSHRVGSYHALFARSVQFAEVTDQYQRLHATISLNERHQGVNSLEIAVPEGFDVTDVGSTFLDSWNIAENVLTLKFRERVSGLTTISLAAVKTGTFEGDSWRFPLFQPRDVVTHSAVLGLFVDQDLDRLAVSSRGLMAIDTLSLRAAIPASALSPFPGSPTLRLLSAHYAPEVSGAKLNTMFRRPEVILDAAVNQTLTLTDGRPLLTADTTVMPQTGRVFGTTISLPNTWRITRIVDASNNTELKFHIQETSNDMRDDVRIDFPQGVRSHEAFRFVLTAVPREENYSVQTSQVDFPCLDVLGTRNQTGRIAVQDRSEEDWEITATHTGAVTAADRTGTNDLIFDYTAVPLSLSLELAKRAGRATAKTIAFYRFTPTLVHIRYEMAFQIAATTTRSLSCLLPSETPATVSIVGLDGLTIKETFSEPAEDSAWRRWRVELPRPMTGTLRLAIDFDLPLSLTGDTANECTLLSVIAEGVTWQSHLVAIEGDEELDVAIPTEAGTLRPVDTGLTVGATYTPGQRLLGVFATKSDIPATVSLRLNTLTSLPEAMIRRTTVTARLAEKLGVMYEAHYDMQFAGGSVVFTFPSDIEFWGSDLDGTAIRPQRVGDDIIIPIPRGAANVSRTLRLFWWSPQQHSTLAIPQVSTASRRVIPSLETVWQVIPPRGKRVVTIGGERVNDINNSTITIGDSWSTDRKKAKGDTSPPREAYAFFDTDLAKSGEGTLELASRSSMGRRPQRAEQPVPPSAPGASSRSRLTSAQPVSLALSSHDARPPVRFAVVGSRFAETLDVQLVDDRAALRWSIVTGCIVLLLGLTTLTLPRRLRVAFLFIIIAIAILTTSLIADDTTDNAPPLVIPAEAILVPYSLDAVPEGTLPDAASLTRPDQPLWVPYRKYIEMLDALDAKKKSVPVLTPAIVPYSLDAVEYTVTTPQPTDTSITLRGEMRLHVWVPEPVFIPIPLAGGALEMPQLDGKPTICQSLSETQSLFRVEGVGEHRLTFAVRFRIDRQGGWRLVTGTLPTAIANKVSFITPPLTQPNSSPKSSTKSDELWTNHSLDQRKWTLTPGGVIETSLPSTDPNSGSVFQWQWRLGMQGDVVDRSLEAESLVAVTLQEDGCWVDWTPTLKIGRGTWDAIRCAVPSDYTIVEIVGSNVRGWDMLANDIIDVEMLKPAEGNEQFVVRLFKPLVIDKDKGTAWTWTLPTVSLPDAGLHRGRIDIRRSAVLQLRAAAVQGLAPTDLAESVPEFDSASPLGIVPFQSYRFHGDTKNITLEATPIVATQHVSVTSRLNIAQHLTPKLRTIATVETTITFPPNPRPFEAVVTLPRGFLLRQLHGDDGVVVVARSQDTSTDTVSVIDILQANSTTAPVSVVFGGEFDAIAIDPNRLTSLPTFTVTTSDERPTDVDNVLFVLTDPALDAHIEKLRHGWYRPISDFIERLLPTERDWLRRVVEGRQTRETPEPPTGEVILSRRTPNVTCSTITNIRATNDALEETILLDFTIQNAGVRQVAFMLPGSLRDATIDAPLLRRIKRTQIDTVDAESMLVELELQDAVMNQFRVLVRSDRRLDISTAYRITTPTVRDAQVTEQYVVLENDRRSLDEMTVTDPMRLQRLSRQQRPWSYLASMLGNNVTEAYCVNRDAKSGDAVNTVPSLIVPSLVVQMRRRETVRLAEARIDLAETRILCGNNGVYCAEQVYRIDNKKEPYLDLRLPPDATLWGASLFSAAAWTSADRSAGIPVKPCQMPESVAVKYGNDSTQLVRIPLVKTESGDLDYVIRLIYAGTLPPISRETLISKSVELPFISVLNISVGASIVRLSLPKSYYYQFDGNLQRVASDQQQQATKKLVDDYLLQQNIRLSHAAKSENSFAKSRAYSNQQQLAVMNSSDSSTINLNGSGYYTSGAVPVSGETEQGRASEANSSQLTSQFYLQSNTRANDEVLRGRNDYASTQPQQPAKPEQSEKKEVFDQRWFGANNLVTVENADAVELDSSKRELEEVQTFDAELPMENRRMAGRRGMDVTRGTIVLGEEKQLSGNTRRDQSILQLQGNLQQQGAPQALAPAAPLALGSGAVAVDQPMRQPMGMGSSSSAALGVEFGGQMPPQPANAPAPALADKLSVLVTRTASLDIEIPDLADYELYLFTTPQGSLELSLRSAPRNTVARIASVLLSLIVLAACYGIYRLAIRFPFARNRNMPSLVSE